MGNGSNIIGPSQAAEEIGNLSEMKTAIQRELEQEAEGFVRIGYLLKRTRDTRMFTEDGHESLYDFAKAEYSLDRSTVSRFISINERYSVDGDSPELDKKYSGFGRTKLAEMLTLPVEFVEEIRQEVTREEIRELKREIKEETEHEKVENSKNETEKTVEDHIENAVAPAQQNSINTKAEEDLGETEDLLKKAILGLFKTEEYKPKMEKIIMLARKGLPNEELEDRLEEIISKTGYAQAKVRGGIYIFFKSREEGITCMKVGGVKEFYSYSDFFGAFVEVFQPEKGEKWVDVWDRQYGGGPPEEKPVTKEIEKPEDTIELPVAEEKTEQEGQIPGQAYIEDYPEVLQDSGGQVWPIPGIAEPEIEPKGETDPTGVTTKLAAENLTELAAGKGSCKHCIGKTFKKILSSNGQFSLTINGDMAFIVFDGGEGHANGIMRFNFCPMCGRGLGGLNGK